jgi:5-methyltetrahydrofolate--homocysteine methyltransferase
MSEIAVHAQIIGGCCGTAPEHIAAMINQCRDIPFTPIEPKEYTAVSSYGKTVVFGDRSLVIGERINPTGKPRMKEALRENEMDFLYREGLAQIQNGADILDVNAGLPGIDEKAALARLVTGLQSISDIPLQIDTTDTLAAERALRLYNGKPLLNSVSGKRESLDKILPLVKKYGAVTVCLTLDDDGIPETADGRVEIAATIISEAEKYGIHKKNLIADTLAMTIGTDGKNAGVTLTAMEQIKEKLNIHTVLGISNVSFGLPARDIINAVFFVQAMNRGLSAGIINPMSASMMDAYFAHHALRGYDVNCAEYIERYSALSSDVKKTENIDVISLSEAIIGGMKEQSAKAAKLLLKDKKPEDIIDGILIPALDKVGLDYEKGVIFLPQLLMSAESANAAFEIIKDYFSVKGESRDVSFFSEKTTPKDDKGKASLYKKRGKIVLATVKGDIHDIGKNIVKVLLENYNFEVIDLGKNVEPTTITETVLKENVKLVGLSALMTTTVVFMEETIIGLKEKAPDCRVMVGGAVLTEEYAKEIGADFYSKDAMGGVRYAGLVYD